MKKTSRTTLIILSLALSIMLFSTCKKKETINPEYKTESYEIAPWVKNIPTETFLSITDISNDGEITFDSQSSLLQELKAGDILVSGPIEKAPNGFLRRVESTKLQGSDIVIKTLPATLEDVFITLDLDIDKDLTIEDLKGAPDLKEGISFNPQSYTGINFYTEINEPLYSNGPLSITASGYCEISPSFRFSLKIKDRKINKVSFQAGIEESSKLQLDVSGQLSFNPEVNIASFYFHPIVFMVGFVPVVITPKLDIILGAEVSAESSISTSVSQNVEFSAGIKYEDQQWEPFSEFNKSFQYSSPELTASANAKGYLGPELNLLLYGVVGPYTDLNAFLELNANVTNTPWWKLFGGIDVGIGLQSELFSNDMSDLYYPSIVDYRVLLAEASQIADGSVQGIVKNAITSDPIQSVSVKVFQNSTNVANGTTDINGEFMILVPSGDNYTVTFTKNGYIAVDYSNIDVSPSEPTILEPILQIDENHSGDGNISGQIVNALNGIGVGDISLKLRQGVNATSGSVIKSTATDNSGSYSMTNVSAGNYTIEANGDGFEKTYFTVISIGGQTTGNQDATITPQMNDGETRIILNWGESPSDLDSHLTGPIPNSSDRFHVFYGNKEFNHNGETYCFLDHDDMISYGPETVTIYNQSTGTYRYSVHDYTNRGQSYSMALSNSSAQIRVYSGGELIKDYYIPSNTEGTLWTVFELNGNNITTINTMSYESNPGSVTGPYKSEMELFRNLPPKHN